MNIQTTQFEFNYYYSEKVLIKETQESYIIHTVEFRNQIIVDDIKLSATYETGLSYIYLNNYDYPRSDLELYEDEDVTHPVLIVLNRLTREEIEENENDCLDDIKESLSIIDTKAKALQLYDELNENIPIVEQYEDSFNVEFVKMGAE